MSEDSTKQTLTEIERKLIAFCEQKWFLTGTLPTPETLREKFDLSAKQINGILNNELVQQSFEGRGIPTIQGRDLTPTQILVLNAIINPSETRSERKILSDAGITAATMAGWRRDPRVQEYLLQRTEQLLGASIPDAHLALVDKVRAGDMSALKFYYEITGRYTGQNAGMDPRTLLEQVFGIIARYVKDPQVLMGISTEFMALAGIDSSSTLNSEAPVAGVIVNELEGL